MEELWRECGRIVQVYRLDNRMPKTSMQSKKPPIFPNLTVAGEFFAWTKIHNPTAKAPVRRLYRANRGSRRPLLGAPVWISSLTDLEPVEINVEPSWISAR
jgi:hypothetical protein